MSLIAEDRPNSYIGSSVPRPNARRLLQGRGRYVDDKTLPRMLHAAFHRSPYAHARVLGIDTAAARAMAGVVAVYTGADMAREITPWVGVLTHLSGMRSPPQPALALDVARWVGEPVVMVVAQSRAEAEDALAVIEVEYDPQPAVTDMEGALDPAAARVHPDLDSNLCWDRSVDVGDVDVKAKRMHVEIDDQGPIDRTILKSNLLQGVPQDRQVDLASFLQVLFTIYRKLNFCYMEM